MCLDIFFHACFESKPSKSSETFISYKSANIRLVSSPETNGEFMKWVNN